jgi:hypothetical protein
MADPPAPIPPRQGRAGSATAVCGLALALAIHAASQTAAPSSRRTIAA